MNNADAVPLARCACGTTPAPHCLIDDVVKGLARRSLEEPATRSISDAIELALRRQLPVEWVRLRPLPLHAPAIDPGQHLTDGVVRVPIALRSGDERWMLEIGLRPGHPMSAADRHAVQRAASVWELAVELARRGGFAVAAGRAPGHVRDGAAPLIGHSPAMRTLRDRIERVAASDFTVLIEGESGSGKELVARQIHELSGRRRGPFVAVNCAALVESLLEAELFGIEDRTATGVRGRRGKFECASGGTLFLDEVADLAPSAQAKLLRAIQECAVERVGSVGTRRLDLRLVVATNRCLKGLAAEGAFRPDLYYRLGGVELKVPPLRTRREDVVELAEYFLSRHGGMRRLGLSAEAADALVAYGWPGNVRELERMMESVVVLARGSRVEVTDLPHAVRGKYAEVLEPSLADGDSLRRWGGRYVRLVWERCGQNKREACRILNISYHTLQVYLRPEGETDALPASRESRRSTWPKPAVLPAVAHERPAECARDSQRASRSAVPDARPAR